MLVSFIAALMAILSLGAFIIAYFIPTLIALNRDLEKAGRIFAINTLVGWTLVGWLVALGMSLKNSPTTTAHMFNAK